MLRNLGWQVAPLLGKSRQQRILKLLNLEETVTPAKCAFAIERSKGVFLAAAASPFNSPCAKPWSAKEKWVAHLAASELTRFQEFYVSARNGDKSRFNRKRKQKIARRKHTRELLERTAKARKAN